MWPACRLIAIPLNSKKGLTDNRFSNHKVEVENSFILNNIFKKKKSMKFFRKFDALFQIKCR